MGAALSYYTVFSLAPLLLIVISIAGLVFGQDAARGEIFGQLRGMMGDDAAKAVEGLLASVNKPAQGITATVIGVAVLLVGATSVFGELQDALDRIWRAPARNKVGGLWGLLRTRLLSFGMILGIAFLLMVSLVLGAAISALGNWWGGFFSGWEVLAQAVNVVVGFALTTDGVRDDLQADAARQRALARRGARRAGHVAALHDRQVPDRPVHRQERRRVGVRRGRLARRRLRLGLLLGADLPAGRRVHLGLRAHLRLDAASSRRAAPRRGCRRSDDSAAADGVPDRAAPIRRAALNAGRRPARPRRRASRATGKTSVPASRSRWPCAI